MARTEVFSDDLSGETGPDVAPVTLSVSTFENGKLREIDLGTVNTDALNAALAPFLNASRPAPQNSRKSSGRKSGAATTPASTPAVSSGNTLSAESDAIRAFARANGIEVSDRGRIKNAARKAWEDAGRPGLDGSTTAATVTDAVGTEAPAE